MTYFEVIRKKIREDMNDLADFLSTGGAADYNAYRHAVGKIEGLAVAERHVLDLEERLLKDAES